MEVAVENIDSSDMQEPYIPVPGRLWSWSSILGASCQQLLSRVVILSYYFQTETCPSQLAVSCVTCSIFYKIKTLECGGIPHEAASAMSWSESHSNSLRKRLLRQPVSEWDAEVERSAAPKRWIKGFCLEKPNWPYIQPSFITCNLKFAFPDDLNVCIYIYIYILYWIRTS